MVAIRRREAERFQKEVEGERRKWLKNSIPAKMKRVQASMIKTEQ
jgi:hypothetical protein